MDMPKIHVNKYGVYLIIAAVIAALLLAGCFHTGPKAPTDPTVSWPALADTRENYTPRQAEEDGCVVVDNSTLRSGEKLLADFVNAAASGRPAAVRVYHSYSDQGDFYYVMELRYDGQSYHLQFYDRTGDTGEEFLSQNTYRYFARDLYVWNPQTFQTRQCYLLFDHPEVTAQGYYNHTVSSSVSPEDHIYNHCKFLFSQSNFDLSETLYGVAYSDVDGDGVEERCCLGAGRTSGLFTFTLRVYEDILLEYEDVYCTRAYDLRFLQAEDGTLQIEGVTQGDAPETHIFDLVVQDGRIVLKAGDLEHIPYN